MNFSNNSICYILSRSYVKSSTNFQYFSVLTCKTIVNLICKRFIYWYKRVSMSEKFLFNVIISYITFLKIVIYACFIMKIYMYERLVDWWKEWKSNSDIVSKSTGLACEDCIGKQRTENDRKTKWYMKKGSSWLNLSLFS